MNSQVLTEWLKKHLIEHTKYQHILTRPYNMLLIFPSFILVLFWISTHNQITVKSTFESICKKINAIVLSHSKLNKNTYSDATVQFPEIDLLVYLRVKYIINKFRVSPICQMKQSTDQSLASIFLLTWKLKWQKNSDSARHEER